MWDLKRKIGDIKQKWKRKKAKFNCELGNGGEDELPTDNNPDDEDDNLDDGDTGDDDNDDSDDTDDGDDDSGGDDGGGDVDDDGGDDGGDDGVTTVVTTVMMRVVTTAQSLNQIDPLTQRSTPRACANLNDDIEMQPSTVISQGKKTSRSVYILL